MRHSNNLTRSPPYRNDLEDKLNSTFHLFAALHLSPPPITFILPSKNKHNRSPSQSREAQRRDTPLSYHFSRASPFVSPYPALASLPVSSLRHSAGGRRGCKGTGIGGRRVRRGRRVDAGSSDCRVGWCCTGKKASAGTWARNASGRGWISN